MHTDCDIDLDQPLEELMRQWPSAVPVFIRHNILCVGCALSSFHCLRDASALHGVDSRMIVREILAAAPPRGSDSGEQRDRSPV
ncbi:MAG: hypothetical protein R3D45_01930 [Rhizobiaceae bacterium]